MLCHGGARGFGTRRMKSDTLHLYFYFFGSHERVMDLENYQHFVLQVFLDVVESVNILVNSNGQIVRSDVIGELKMRTFLR
jgi:hypothetical protein